MRTPSSTATACRLHPPSSPAPPSSTPSSSPRVRRVSERRRASRWRGGKRLLSRSRSPVLTLLLFHPPPPSRHPAISASALLPVPSSLPHQSTPLTLSPRNVKNGTATLSTSSPPPTSRPPHPRPPAPAASPPTSLVSTETVQLRRSAPRVRRGSVTSSPPLRLRAARSATSGACRCRSRRLEERLTRRAQGRGRWGRSRRF